MERVRAWLRNLLLYVESTAKDVIPAVQVNLKGVGLVRAEAIESGGTEKLVLGVDWIANA